MLLYASLYFSILCFSVLLLFFLVLLYAFQYFSVFLYASLCFSELLKKAVCCCLSASPRYHIATTLVRLYLLVLFFHYTHFFKKSTLKMHSQKSQKRIPRTHFLNAFPKCIPRCCQRNQTRNQVTQASYRIKSRKLHAESSHASYMQNQVTRVTRKGTGLIRTKAPSEDKGPADEGDRSAGNAFPSGSGQEA